jgi:uncharacterized protein (UPF0335 family)
MKITKSQLKQIIKEELTSIDEGFKTIHMNIQYSIEEILREFSQYGIDLEAIQAIVGDMINDEKQYGREPNIDAETLKLAKELGLDPADYPAEGQLESEINKKMA